MSVSKVTINIIVFLMISSLTSGMYVHTVQAAKDLGGGDNKAQDLGSAGGKVDDLGKGGGRVGGSARLINPLEGSGINSIPTFFIAVINILIIFAIPFVTFFIVYAGFLYVRARGNPDAITKAHMALLYALIGGLLILGSRTILTVINNTAQQIVTEEFN